MKMLGVIIGIIILVVLGSSHFIFKHPQFGGKTSDSLQNKLQQSPNYRDGIFNNKEEVSLKMSFKDLMTSLGKYINPPANTVPESNLDVLVIDSMEIVNYNEAVPRIIWFGHSSFLIQINGKNLLLDPIFSSVPAPHPKLGKPRFSTRLPISLEKLPPIDAVIISHDHYDHLDYKSIITLQEKTKHFYAPLGVSKHLLKWGVSSQDITELDWWDEIQVEDLTFACTPAQHFSGRTFSDRSSTLWASWVIQSKDHKIFFSGDSGYGKHFKEIGEKYGPFDFALMECGQYNEKWHSIHMYPEETIVAAKDIQAKAIMPIHWAAFKLAEHSWTDPVERISMASQTTDVVLCTPKIGEIIELNMENRYPNEKWWQEYLDR